MNATEILDELKPLGTERYKQLLFKNYGVREPCFGVKIGDMQKIRKRIKTDYRLALDLYDTGNYDAMYLAGLIADDARMTKQDLNRWVKKAYAGALAGTTVASVAVGSPHGHEIALEWIESNQPLVASAGWATLGGLVTVTADSELDLPELRRLLQRVRKTIHQQPDPVRYQMNHFIIAVGGCVKPLTDLAIQTGEAIGPVTADLGPNNCQVFSAPEYIRKVQKHGSLGKKRKTVKC